MKPIVFCRGILNLSLQYPFFVKNLFTIVFVFLFYLPAYCAIKTVVANAGQGWGNNANWSPAGIPVDGDEIVIPVGQIISVKGSFYSGTENFQIQVHGTLDFDPSGKLNLGSLSTVQLHTSTSAITTNGSASEQIVINGQIKYQGSIDGTLNGPKYASNTTASSPNGFTLGIVPVKLISFSGQTNKEEVILKWKTADEIYTEKFDVERSIDGRAWKSIAVIRTTGSNSNYSFTDQSPVEGDNYYRLKTTDINGYIEYFHIVKLKLNKTKSITIGANPVVGYLTIYLPKTMPACRVQLFDAAGHIVKNEVFHQQSTTIRLKTSELNQGNYFVKLYSPEFVFQTRIVIN